MNVAKNLPHCQEVGKDKWRYPGVFAPFNFRFPPDYKTGPAGKNRVVELSTTKRPGAGEGSMLLDYLTRLGLPARTTAISLTLGLLAVGILMFSLEAFTVDLVTLILVLGLILCGILTPEEAFSGFSSDIIVILAAVFIVSGGLQRTGVVDAMGARLLRFSGKTHDRFVLVMMMLVGGLAAFMNSTTVTALFLPPVMGIAKKLKLSPSKLLLPMAYASMLGGTCTLIGATTNIAVNAYMRKVGLEPLGLFEITPIGLIILGTGIVYVVTIASRLLPDHPVESFTEEYGIREYLSEIVIVSNSHLIGQRIYDSGLGRLDFQILGMVRANQMFVPDGNALVQSGDVLLVKGKATELMKVKEIAGIEILPELELNDHSLQNESIRVAEALVNPRSELIGKTLRDVSFRQHYGLTALAIYRHGHSLREKIGNIGLRMGDLLLVQGAKERIESLRRHPDLSILEELNPVLYKRKKGCQIALLFFAAVVLSGFGILPLSVAFLLAALLTILCGCLDIQEAYTFIDWRLLILIGGMTAFGVAMEKTGAADLLAGQIVHWFKPLGAEGIMAGFFLLTVLLTQPMSNSAAALVVLPVALQTAHALQVNERTFAIAIMLAASISFITPFEPSCILVYGPGKYRFRDFVRCGLGLTIVLTVVIFLLVPAFWPLRPFPHP